MAETNRRQSQAIASNRSHLTAIWKPVFIDLLICFCFRDKFRDNYASFRKAFEQMDTNRDGLISRSELMKVLFEHHFYMNDSELIVLLNRYICNVFLAFPCLSIVQR